MRSIKAYELVRAAIRARAQQEAVLKLMRAVQHLGERANAEATRANEAAGIALGDLPDHTRAHFVVVDGQTWAVNRGGCAPISVEVL